MKRIGARTVLVACIALWVGAVWGLSVGAFAAQLPPLPVQTCIPGAPPPLGCPAPSGTGSSSPSPSGSASEEPPAEQDSQITIKYANNKFSGVVKSDSSTCERNRQVKVKKRGARVIGNDITDDAGRWSLRYPNPNGKRYFAKVAPKQAGSTTCNGARSRTIRAE